MKRREFIVLTGGAAAWPVVARAQEPGRVYRLGILTGLPRTAKNYAALYDGLARLGFVAGKNLRVDGDGFGLKPDQYEAHAAALVKTGVDLIQCSGTDAFRAAQHATKTIPIMGGTDDMLGEGLVRSFAHPGGNTTGVSILASDLDGKRLQLLLELLPGARRVAALVGADSATPARSAALRDVAHSQGVELATRTVNKAADVSPALAALKAEGAAGVNVLASALLFFNRKLILERNAALRFPAIYQWPDMAEPGDGGLIGYGPRLDRIYGDQLARMAAKIFRGTKPADLPVQQPTKFDLVVNLKAAKALGLVIPQTVATLADEVIE